MEIYTNNTSDIIRQDFLRFYAGAGVSPDRRRTGFETEGPLADIRTPSLDDLRADLANDDGHGSFGSYKSSIF